MRLTRAVGCGLSLIGVWLVVTPPARRARTGTGERSAFGERYVYVVTQSPDASGRTGLSLVRVEKANGAEAGRVWLSGKPAEYEVDPGTGTAYVQTGNREIIAARFP